ncbi:MAG: hypothetical protein JWQ64_1193 [Subtercola sp.]|nr:hypothetical protein [Subtercola sp.]
MSEPDGFYVSAIVSKEHFLSHLDASTSLATKWNDWQQLGGEWQSFDWVSDGHSLLASADSRLSSLQTNRDAWCTFIDDQDAPLSAFSYDEDSRELILATAMFRENLQDIVELLAVARGLASFCSDDEHLDLVVRDFVWSDFDETVSTAALTGTGGGSQLIDTADRQGALARLEGDAQAWCDNLAQGSPDASNAGAAVRLKAFR